jgi:hypothetical protein
VHRDSSVTNLCVLTCVARRGGTDQDKVANVLHTALTLLKHCVAKYAPTLGARETQVR